MNDFYAFPTEFFFFAYLPTFRNIELFPETRHFSPLSMTIKFEPVHEISNNVVCATSKASDQPAHTRSLIRVFASPSSIL